jgi:carboxypeptidase-like protein/TonB-dependent receptor-like protein
LSLGVAQVESNTSATPCVLRGRMSIRSLIYSLLTVASVAMPTSAQDSDALGLAIAESCGQVDGVTEGVVAGTVRDEDTGVALDGASVVMRWQAEGELYPSSFVVRTDDSGFFLFCHAPGGYDVELHAELLDKRSSPIQIQVEFGTFLVEHIELEFSDVTQPGYVIGRVVDSESRMGVAGAEVRVRDAEMATLTNDHGLFSLEGMPWGIYVIEVVHLGYAPREIPLRVTGGLTQNVEILVSQQAMEVEGLTVTVEPRRFHGAMEGLIGRMELGFGDYLTRDQIDMRGASFLPDLLVGLPGVRLFEGGRSLIIRGRECIPLVFVDGIRWFVDPVAGLKEIPTSDIEALEFYKGTASIPAEFNFSTNGQVGCGAIVVWTRRGR